MLNNTEYVRFRTEKEFLKSVLSSLGSFGPYPKVSAIAGEKIYPDIDSLKVEKASKDKSIFIGFELKLIKFDKRSKSLSLNSFYQGIGQALLYLLHGVDHSGLILGFHENILENKLINDFREKVWNKRKSLANAIRPYLFLGIYHYKRDYVGYIIESKSNFYHSSPKTKLFQEALLQGNFTYNKRLKEKHKGLNNT